MTFYFSKPIFIYKLLHMYLYILNIKWRKANNNKVAASKTIEHDMHHTLFLCTSILTFPTWIFIEQREKMFVCRVNCLPEINFRLSWFLAVVIIATYFFMLTSYYRHFCFFSIVLSHCSGLFLFVSKKSTQMIPWIANR